MVVLEVFNVNWINIKIGEMVDVVIMIELLIEYGFSWEDFVYELG